jgi:hypothetical protein
MALLGLKALIRTAKRSGVRFCLTSVKIEGRLYVYNLLIIKDKSKYTMSGPMISHVNHEH